MKKKEIKSKKDKVVIIHPGVQAMIDDGLYNDPAKLQQVINKFLKKASDLKKVKKAKDKTEKIIVVKKVALDKKAVTHKKAAQSKKPKK